MYSMMVYQRRKASMSRVKGRNNMTVTEKILQHIQGLPESLQAEVLDFIEYLESKKIVTKNDEENRDWSILSLSSALRGMENESSLYTVSDLKEHYQ